MIVWGAEPLSDEEFMAEDERWRKEIRRAAEEERKAAWLLATGVKLTIGLFLGYILCRLGVHPW